MEISEIKQLQINATKARMGAIIGTYNAKSGHPGGSLSAADVLTYLYFKEMNVDPSNPNADVAADSIGHIARGQSVCRGEHQPAALVCVHGGPVLCLWCAVPRTRCAPAARRCEALASAAEDPRLFQCHNGELRRRHGVYRAAHGAAFRQHFAHRAGHEPAHPVAAAGRVHRLLPRGAARPCLGMGRHGARVGDGVAAAVYPRCGKRALKTSGCSAVHRQPHGRLVARAGVRHARCGVAALPAA